MDNDVIIRVENLGKRYSLRHQRPERYTALRDVLTDKARSLFRRNGGKNLTSDLCLPRRSRAKAGVVPSAVQR